uniref:Uncharacterized protein n=1 Tax=Alexandrium monilatum TaxID=311494 RepID=A0A6T1LFW7_9DINO
MAQQRRPLLGAGLLALLAVVLLSTCPGFVGPAVDGRQAPRGPPLAEVPRLQAEATAPAAERASPSAAISASAAAGALMLAVEPALALSASYDERQSTASGMMVFVIVAAVVITAGFVAVLTNLYK